MHARWAASLLLRCRCRHTTFHNLCTPRHTHRPFLPPLSPLHLRWQHSSAVSPTSGQRRPCIVVIGGGAIGLLFTALLTLTPQPPHIFIISRSLSARPTSVPPVQIELLPATLARLAGNTSVAASSPFVVPRSSIFSSAAELLSSPAAPPVIRAVLITTKGLPALSRAIIDAEQLSRHFAHHPPLIVPVMNGVAHLTHLPAHFHPSRLLYATTSQGAHWATSDVVCQAGSGVTSFVLPVGSGDKADESVRWFCSLVCTAAMDVRVAAADELLCVHWSKLLVNCVVNPLTGLLNVRNGWLEQWLQDDSAARHIVRHVVREVVEVGRRHGVTFTFDGAHAAKGELSEAEVDAAVASMVAVVRATAANVSSMASDVRAGRVTEIDGMNGEVVRLGDQYGVETPYNRALWELVRELHPTGGQWTKQAKVGYNP